MTELVVLLLAAPIVTCAAVVGLRSAHVASRRHGRRTFELTFPRGIKPEAVETFVRSLSGLQLPRWQRLIDTPSVVFETFATDKSVSFFVMVERGAAEFVLGQVRAALPGVRVTPTQMPHLTALAAAELSLAGRDDILRVERPEQVSTSILSALRPLDEGEELVVQWVIAPAAPPPPVRRSWMMERLGFATAKPQPKPTKGERQKQEGPHLVAAVRLGATAADVQHARRLLRRLLGAFHVTSGQRAHLRRRLIPQVVTERRLRLRTVPLISFPLWLTTKELSVVVGIPMGSIVVPGLELGAARQLPVPPELPADGPALGRSNYAGSDRPLTFGPRSLPTHAWVLGGTGSGKSTLLHNLVVDYLEANGSVILIDSKRDLAADVLGSLPPKRIRDVVLLDPADRECVIGVNLLAAAPDERERTADQLVGLFTRLWPGYVGPRSQDLLRAGFLTLLQTPGMTFVELPMLFTDGAFRRRVVSRLNDPVVLEPQWAQFDNLSAGERAMHVAPLMNKLRAILARRALRDIVGQANGLNLGEVVNRSCVVLCPLSKGLLGGDAAALLGSVLLMRLWQVLSARVGISRSDRRPLLIVLDEFQDYLSASLDFADTLAQARALGVGIVCAHQHLAQLTSDVRQALRTNARTKVTFQLAGTDARTLAQEFTPHLTAEDLQGLGRYEIAAQICLDGRVLPPATGATFAPPSPTGVAEAARAWSNQHYARSRADVDAEIRARHGERPGGGSIGRRRRS